jgi:exportin-2 (importin alpha re-exporter)
VQTGYLTAYLGIFQNLLSTKANDHHGLELLKSIYEYVPINALDPFIKNTFIVIFTRLLQTPTPKLTTAYLEFIVNILNLNIPVDLLISHIDSIQQSYILLI